MQINQIAVGKMITEMRQKMGYNKSELAALIDSSASTVGNWEKGKSSPPVPEWCKICEVCESSNGLFDQGSLQGPFDYEILAQLEVLKEKASHLYEIYRNPDDEYNIIDSVLDHMQQLMRIGKALNLPQDNQPPPASEAKYRGQRAFTLVSGTGPEDPRHYSAGFIAAGFAGELNGDTPTSGYIKELAHRSDIGYFRVVGESMEPMYKDGEMIVVENNQLQLGEQFISMNLVKTAFPEGTVIAFELNGNPSIKRVTYQGREESWGMRLEAINQEWAEGNEYPRLVERGDDLIIHGKVLGRVNKFE